MEIECNLKGEDLKEDLGRVKSHCIGISQQWLSQLNIRVPERPLPVGESFSHEALEGIMEKRNISDEENPVSKEGIAKENQI